jgi:hypothetical protein
MTAVPTLVRPPLHMFVSAEERLPQLLRLFRVARLDHALHVGSVDVPLHPRALDEDVLDVGPYGMGYPRG